MGVLIGNVKCAFIDSGRDKDVRWQMYSNNDDNNNENKNKNNCSTFYINVVPTSKAFCAAMVFKSSR